jgi:hypothetical protein
MQYPLNDGGTMYPWEKDHNDPKKIVVTDLKGHTKQVAYCASPEVASLVLHRCASQPVLLEACRVAHQAIVSEVGACVDADTQISDTLALAYQTLRLAIAAADPTSKEPTP